MIDGYAHCGVSKYRPVEDVLDVMRCAGVDQAVLCQHLGEYDNRYLAQVVADHPGRFAAVCLVDPTSPSAAADLEKWRAGGGFRGVRLLAEWLGINERLWADAVSRGLTLVLYAPHGAASASDGVRGFLRRHPAARLVMTHLGNPQVRDGRVEDASLLTLADEAGVYVQLSGLSQFCEYPFVELHDLVRKTVAAFGASRVYWGSNYPVCGDAAAYLRDLRQVASGEWGLTTDQTEWITHRTAASLWFDPLFSPAFD